MPSTVSPGSSSARKTAWFAWLPECGWTLAKAQPKSYFARSIARVSMRSANAAPP